MKHKMGYIIFVILLISCNGNKHKLVQGEIVDSTYTNKKRNFRLLNLPINVHVEESIIQLDHLHDVLILQLKKNKIKIGELHISEWTWADDAAEYDHDMMIENLPADIVADDLPEDVVRSFKDDVQGIYFQSSDADIVCSFYLNNEARNYILKNFKIIDPQRSGHSLKEPQ